MIQVPVTFDPDASVVAKPNRESAYQLFKDLDAVAIAEQVLGEHGITVEKRVQ